MSTRFVQNKPPHLENTELTKLSKWGNSQAIRIPKNILDETSMQANQEVAISTNKNNEIVISKVESSQQRSHRTNNYLETLFENYDEDYQTKEIDWGAPVGHEVWE